MVAIRWFVVGLAEKDAVILPFPDPEVVIVHQPILLAAVQAEFETTEKTVVPAVAATFWFAGVTERVAAAATWKEPTIPIAACGVHL